MNTTLAESAIEHVKDKGIVVIFPTEYKKERILRNIAKTKPSVQKDINKIRDQRAKRLALWQSEINAYEFSKISIVPDSLLKSYIADPDHALSVDKNGLLQSSSLNDIYALYTDYGGFEVKNNGTFVPNPFPNQVKASKWAAIRDFMGVQGNLKSINSFFTQLNGTFSGYYTLMNNKGTYPSI